MLKLKIINIIAVNVVNDMLLNLIILSHSIQNYIVFLLIFNGLISIKVIYLLCFNLCEQHFTLN